MFFETDNSEHDESRRTLEAFNFQHVMEGVICFRVVSGVLWDVKC